MNRNILTSEELDEATSKLDGWEIDGKMIKKSLKFENFSEALSYVNAIGVLAEIADHHPDITFGWGYAEIALTTHDRDGVTDVDIDLATKIDAV